jgi:hypothetical protein
MFQDILGGTYYPAVSCYMGAKVKFNFGPDFKHPPKDLVYKPVSDVIYQHNAMLCVSDVVTKVANGIEEMMKADLCREGGSMVPAGDMGQTDLARKGEMAKAATTASSGVEPMTFSGGEAMVGVP